ncbi:MAG TPA: hypothetical protein PKE45_11665 [Caldilineaceae bacterium]|nr:hypothetical protein [Caldilineaceae bacterium]
MNEIEEAWERAKAAAPALYWPPEAAGHYEHCTRNLELLAKVIVGETVTVKWFSSTKLLGQAYRRTAEGAVIRLCYACPATRLGEVFFHECGHLVIVEHCPMLTPVDPEWAAEDDTTNEELLALLSEPERTFFDAYLGRHEAEADAYAVRHLAEFEAEFGPFLDFITGQV